MEIRTAVLDCESERGKLGVDSGITYDSTAETEYRECLDKGLFIRRQRQEFHLIESLLHDGNGYFLRERHLARLARSTGYFGFQLADGAAQRLLEQAAARFAPSGRYKVRLLLFPDGSLDWEAVEAAEATPEVKAGFAPTRVHSADSFLYHKTSRRDLYRQELAARPDLG